MSCTDAVPLSLRSTLPLRCPRLPLPPTVTAVFHRLAPNATVIGIDHLPGLAELARNNLAADGIDLGSATGIDIVCGDGRAGFEKHAPYAAIHVGAAAPSIPQPLVEQLATPGRMFIPVGESSQGESTPPCSLCGADESAIPRRG